MKIKTFIDKYGQLTLAVIAFCIPGVIYIAGIQFQINSMNYKLQTDHILFLRDLENKNLVTKIKIDDLSNDLEKTNKSLELINNRLDEVLLYVRKNER